MVHYLFLQLHSYMIPTKGGIFTSCKRRAAAVSMVQSLFFRTYRRFNLPEPI